MPPAFARIWPLDQAPPARRTPGRLTSLAWGLFVLTLPTLILHAMGAGPWSLGAWFTIDGLTVLMWSLVMLFGAVIQTYAKRYMAGDPGQARFAWRVLLFTLAVATLVAGDHVAIFLGAWLVMGALMASLIGHVATPQARAAAAVARGYFLASAALLTAVALGLTWATGQTQVSAIGAGAGDLPGWGVLLAGIGLVGAAVIQSALFPFHTWLLSSMTAPTPASALMHAGFVNAGGILLLRWAPVLTAEPTALLLAVGLGAASGLFGKLVKGVQVDAKRQLGCSTVAQMGFMILQAGLGFFAAAITHLILHGFYKAYEFLSSGQVITRTHPANQAKPPGRPNLAQVASALVAALLGGALFARLTGKGMHLDSGLVLTVFIVLTTLHAVQRSLRHSELAGRVRYLALPILILPAMALYAGAYLAVHGLLAGLPVVTAPTALTPLHLGVIGAFLVTYLAIEAGLHEESDRLYVALMNAGQPPTRTLFGATEERP